MSSAFFCFAIHFTILPAAICLELKTSCEIIKTILIDLDSVLGWI